MPFLLPLNEFRQHLWKNSEANQHQSHKNNEQQNIKRRLISLQCPIILLNKKIKRNFYVIKQGNYGRYCTCYKQIKQELLVILLI